MTSNARDAQVVEARQFMVEEMLRYFRVPPHKVAVALASQGYGRNLNELGISYVRDALKPLAVQMQQEADYKLFPQRAPWRSTEICLSEFTQGDELSRAQAAKFRIETGIKTINEVRESEGLNHIEGEQADLGDLHLIGSGYRVLSEDMGRPAEAPTASSEGPEDRGQVEPGAGDMAPSEQDAGASEQAAVGDIGK
jgi:hypothetical protein